MAAAAAAAEADLWLIAVAVGMLVLTGWHPVLLINRWHASNCSHCNVS
jgi:hypothetical protein